MCVCVCGLFTTHRTGSVRWAQLINLYFIVQTTVYGHTSMDGHKYKLKMNMLKDRHK